MENFVDELAFLKNGIEILLKLRKPVAIEKTHGEHMASIVMIVEIKMRGYSSFII